MGRARQHEALIKKTVDERQFQGYLTGQREATRGEAELIDDHLEDPWKASRQLMFKHWTDRRLAPEKSKVTAPPVVLQGLNIEPVEEVGDWVLANAGARPADRDPVDVHVVKQVRSRTGNITASQADVGGWPNLAENRRELTIPNDPNGDDDGDRYTNLEEWLHGYAAQVEGIRP